MCLRLSLMRSDTKMTQSVGPKHFEPERTVTAFLDFVDWVFNYRISNDNARRVSDRNLQKKFKAFRGENACAVAVSYIKSMVSAL